MARAIVSPKAAPERPADPFQEMPTAQARNSGRATPSRRSVLVPLTGRLLRRRVAGFYSAVDNVGGVQSLVQRSARQPLKYPLRSVVALPVLLVSGLQQPVHHLIFAGDRSAMLACHHKQAVKLLNGAFVLIGRFFVVFGDLGHYSSSINYGPSTIAEVWPVPHWDASVKPPVQQDDDKDCGTQKIKDGVGA